ncbi:MAG: hypothetical protein HHJ12_05425 [Glaciimonas sp.]|nr:hypothetical protein [Glaciimonas sp.]
MPYETMREYEIEYSSTRLPDSTHWAAMVTIYGPSSSPMHRSCIFPLQRVSINTIFTNPEQAEKEAHKVALQMFEPGTQRGPGG